MFTSLMSYVNISRARLTWPKEGRLNTNMTVVLIYFYCRLGGFKEGFREKEVADMCRYNRMASYYLHKLSKLGYLIKEGYYYSFSEKGKGYINELIRVSVIMEKEGTQYRYKEGRVNK
jgi:hypothetical protein